MSLREEVVCGPRSFYAAADRFLLSQVSSPLGSRLVSFEFVPADSRPFHVRTMLLSGTCRIQTFEHGTFIHATRYAADQAAGEE